ncbi:MULTISPECIES: cytochrome b [Thalassolituus]|uniref:Cytochrome b n=1 Tax=Thalassolituus hydrocarboniclasticus TaxID=2742796 RepID=A0ABY6AEP2_9GAMM|nr:MULTISPECIES: cytochrome b [Thalassolituus]UXD89205.1 cytochrome b [Thalassolituus hydrocarboniclasticus]
MLRNTSSSYGWVSIAFHWLMALAVFGLFGLGLYMVELTYYDAWYRGSLDLHKSAGVILALAWLLRLIWKLRNPQPKPLGSKVWEHKIAHLTHILLYLLMLALFISGYLISTADGRAIEVFGLFELPATLTHANQEDVAGVIHWALAWTLMLIAGLHAVAAIKHHWLDKDKTLVRMLKPGA